MAPGPMTPGLPPVDGVTPGLPVGGVNPGLVGVVGVVTGPFGLTPGVIAPGLTPGVAGVRRSRFYQTWSGNRRPLSGAGNRWFKSCRRSGGQSARFAGSWRAPGLPRASWRAQVQRAWTPGVTSPGLTPGWWLGCRRRSRFYQTGPVTGGFSPGPVTGGLNPAGVPVGGPPGLPVVGGLQGFSPGFVVGAGPAGVPPGVTSPGLTPGVAGVVGGVPGFTRPGPVTGGFSPGPVTGGLNRRPAQPAAGPGLRGVYPPGPEDRPEFPV